MAFSRWWYRWRKAFLSVAVLVMAVTAVIWLSYEFWRLTAQPDQLFGRPVLAGGIDLHQRYVESRNWFSGVAVYADPAVIGGTYPPASYVMLWPLVGLLAWEPTVFLWAATSVLALAALVILVLHVAKPTDRLERWFVALIPLCMYATGATVGNGQLAIHCTAALGWAVYLVKRGEGVGRDLAVSALMLFSLVKPSLVAPFFWIVLFCSGTVLPALLIGLGYGAMTLLAAHFQQATVFTLLSQWVAKGVTVNSKIIASHLSVNDLNQLMHTLGLGQWAPSVALGVVALLGAWVALHRRADIWVLMGVGAIVARVWTYHNWYDDLVLIFTLAALWRIFARESDGACWKPAAGVLLLLMLVFLIAPGGHFTLPGRLKSLYLGTQALLWLASLVFLVAWVHRRDSGNS